MKTPQLALSGITKRYGQGQLATTALSEVSFELAAGEFVALWGPSGSGKSTLLHIAGLCDAPTAGTVALDGQLVDFSSESHLTKMRRTKIGYVFQFQNLLSHLSALDNVSLPLLLNGTTLGVARRSSEAALDRLGLGSKCHRLPDELSGGEAQRVGVARAIVHQPSLVLADEPTGSLDSESGQQVLELLHGIAASGITVFMATHNESALKMVNRVVALKDGVLQR